MHSVYPNQRLLKKMTEEMPDEVMDYFRQMVPAAVDPMVLVVGGLKNVKMAAPIICGDASYCRFPAGASGSYS
jgi:hypothetical protein